MSSLNPPRVAHWLLERWASGPQRESLIGDILEQYQRGRSATWYWRQTISAIAANIASEMWRHKFLTVSVVVFSAYLGDIYMFSRLWVWVHKLDRYWYPHLIHSRWSWMMIDPWAYRLKPYLWTSDIVWCAMLAGISWLMSRLHPRQSGLVVTLFLTTQVGLCLPHLRTLLADWLREPSNPIWLFSVLWFSTFTFIAIPFSILLGRAAGARRRSVQSVAGD
jgi:hypothetical protein